MAGEPEPGLVRAGGQPGTSTAGTDELGEQIAGLASAPAVVLQRVLLAVLVAHPVTSRGRCRTCVPWWRRAGHRPTGGCVTRELLRLVSR